MRPRLAYQPQEEGQVVQRSNLHAQNLIAVDQVPQVSLGLKAAAVARAIGIDG